MTIQNTDPRLTAYALGELKGEELANFDAELEADERARTEISEIRCAAEELEREFLKPSGLALSKQQLGRIEGALGAMTKKREVRRGFAGRKFWVGISIARAVPCPAPAWTISATACCDMS